MYGYPWYAPTLSVGASFTKAEEAANLAAQRQSAFLNRQKIAQKSPATAATNPDAAPVAKPPMTPDDKIVVAGAVVLLGAAAWYLFRRP